MVEDEESDSRLNSIKRHMLRVLRIYVRIGLEKEHSNGFQVERIIKAQDSIPSFSYMRLCEILEPTSKEVLYRLEDEITQLNTAIEFIKKSNTMFHKCSAADIVITLIPEVQHFSQGLGLFENKSVKSPLYAKYGEFEFARGLIWYILVSSHTIDDTLFADAVSRIFDTVSYQSGLKIMSKSRKFKRKRNLVKNLEIVEMQRQKALDNILAESIVDLIDFSIHQMWDIKLYTEHKTVVCSVSDFIAQISRCAMDVSKLEYRIREGLKILDRRDGQRFTMRHDRGVLEQLWGDRKYCQEWYRSCIMQHRHGLTHFLLSMIFADFGQFEILGQYYTFAIENDSDLDINHYFAMQRSQLRLPRNLGSGPEEKMNLSAEKEFQSSVFLSGSRLYKKEPMHQSILRLLFFILLMLIGLITVIVILRSRDNASIFSVMQVLSVVCVSYFGAVVSLWKCLSSQTRPIRNAFHKRYEIRRIDHLFNVSYIERIKTKLFHDKKTSEGNIEELRKWIAGKGFKNLGFDFFYANDEKTSMYDAEGILLENLSKVALTDGFSCAREIGYKARIMHRKGEKLYVADYNAGHAIIVSKDTKCKTRVGGV